MQRQTPGVNLDKVTKANISVRISDEFMRAVANDIDWELFFKRPETGERITKTVRAKEIFALLCKNNWDMAEPGCLFWDNIENWNLLSEDEGFKYAGVNPCFTGDMHLLTAEGYRKFEELDGQSVRIVNVDGDISCGKVWCNGEKDTLVLQLSNKQIIKCTPEHKFMTIDGNECMAKDLLVGCKITPYINSKPALNNTYIKLGYMQGDGQLSRLKSECHNGIEVNIGYKDGDIMELFSDEKYTMMSNGRAIYLDGYNSLLVELKFSAEALPYKTPCKEFAESAARS